MNGSSGGFLLKADCMVSRKRMLFPIRGGRRGTGYCLQGIVSNQRGWGEQEEMVVFSVEWLEG